MRQADAPPAARLQAIGILLDRGWGKAMQPVAGEDGEPLRIVIRQINEADADLTPTGTTAGLVNEHPASPFGTERALTLSRRQHGLTVVRCRERARLQ